MGIRCILDSTRFKEKPQGWQTGQMVKEMNKDITKFQVDISLEELANSLVKGCSFKPALLNGSTGVTWVSQQLWALDFDNDKYLVSKITGTKLKRDDSLTIEEQCKRDNAYIVDKTTTIQEQIDKCKELKIYPAFGYTSFSHKNERHKFRLVFCSDEVIIDKDQRNKIQRSFISIFNKSDEVTYDPTRWFYGGKSLIEFDFNNRVDVNKIVETYYKEEKYTKVQSTTKTKVLDPPKENLHIAAIKNLNAKVLRQLLNLDEQIEFIVFNTPLQLYDFVDTINLNDFLGVDGTIFNCVIHEDFKPSAGIIENERGQYIYNCFGCGYRGKIIKIVETLAMCSRYRALEFIKSVYGIQLYTAWQKEYRAVMDENIAYINSGKLEDDYPNTWKMIKNRLPELNTLLIYARDNVVDDTYTVNGVPIFYGSMTYFNKIFEHRSNDKTNKTIQLFCLLNLSNKINPKQLPCDLFNSLEKNRKDNKVAYLTNVYQVNSYNSCLLDNAEAKAIELKENNFTMMGLSREYIFRTFGEGVANELFPQLEGKSLSDESNSITDDLVKIIFKGINRKDYVTEDEVIKKFIKTKNTSYDKVKVQLKRSIQDILNSYNLSRVRANNDIKSKYNIKSKGYPFIILKPED